MGHARIGIYSGGRFSRLSAALTTKRYDVKLLEFLTYGDIRRPVKRGQPWSVML